MRVPPELLRGSPYTAGGESPRSRYVVKMTDGQRDWEIQLPEIATAYEVKVPMSGQGDAACAADMATMTAADREILAEREASARAEGGRARAVQGRDGAEGRRARRAAGVRRGRRRRRQERRRREDRQGRKGRATPAGKPGADKPPAAKASYLLTLARVKELYRARQYELALVELVELERQYPEDEHILSMKGSLDERLGQQELAREAWQQALRINPYNLAILEALQRLSK